MRRILIVSGGYAGFYTAWKLEKRLRTDEASVTLVDPRPYMTYQPFLPEVTAGSIEARHVAVSLRRHLPHTHLIVGSVVHIDHAHRTATIRSADGPEDEVPYDTIVITAGAVTRTFPIPGVADEAIGLKHVEEAVAIRDSLLTAFERAATLPPGPERRALLTVTFVGGGYTGVEGFAELLSLATALLKHYPELSFDDLAFHLVEIRDRILPELTDEPARWAIRHLEKRGARIHLGTSLVSAVDNHIVLSDGTEYDNHLLVWSAGNQSNPVVARHTDLPVDRAGLFRVRADLRLGTPYAAIPDAWAAGDNAAVPDLASDIPGGSFTVPNAQHAVRQGKRLAKNVVADLRGKKVKPYKHHSLGTVATLGLGKGIFQYRRIVIKGLLAWLIHRGYHVLAIPTWERKVRVALVWAAALFYGRDIVSLLSVQHPRAAFIAATLGARQQRETGSPAAATVPASAQPEAGPSGTDEVSATSPPDGRGD
ncbi:NAD(P)/FAD-dependent oxidoreductase [Jiangella rhizosphaerae]|uniref:NAD(P)/FAD-dependent oxidoreductase n=1 Tax=Jiangella rhizosphaerae TaxID=2293569 RepID=A0A418KV51_9ACTN|nr:NAD(P)/FAD-dependent oxidoreductase [Jiangella rhizosphaerae]RIQ34019.1 NAD(P)/FAD-dependent oxidoreductase [Jiangella rhizosphaerae]